MCKARRPTLIRNFFWQQLLREKKRAYRIPDCRSGRMRRKPGRKRAGRIRVELQKGDVCFLSGVRSDVRPAADCSRMSLHWKMGTGAAV